jgi:hypothetical protein
MLLIEFYLHYCCFFFFFFFLFLLVLLLILALPWGGIACWDALALFCSICSRQGDNASLDPST